MKYAPTACIHAGSPQRITRKNKPSPPPVPERREGGETEIMYVHLESSQVEFGKKGGERM